VGKDLSPLICRDLPFFDFPQKVTTSLHDLYVILQRPGTLLLELPPDGRHIPRCILRRHSDHILYAVRLNSQRLWVLVLWSIDAHFHILLVLPMSILSRLMLDGLQSSVYLRPPLR
jgi:hypothetical protein